MNLTTEGLSRYIERVRSIPKLSREEEYEVAMAAKNGDEQATKRLIEANLRYVVSVALKYRRYQVPLDELIAEGSVGLMTAVKKFEPERGNRFVTYAGYWIRAYVLDLVVRSATLVGGGTGPFRSKIFFRLRRERAKLVQKNLPREEIEARLAESFGFPVTKIRSLLERLDGKDVSLSQTAYRESPVTLQDLLPSNDAELDEQYAETERKSTLQERIGLAMKDLDKRERLIIEKRILGHDDVSLASLGRELGVSRERARQLEVRAKRKLKRHFQDFAHEFAA